MSKKRLCLTAEEVTEKSLCICRNIQKLPQFACAKKILCYTAFNNEADLGVLINECFDTGRQVFLPVLTGPSAFEAHAYTKGGKLTENKYGIPEPADGIVIRPEDLDMIIVPGLAFDHRLHRIGFGAGYYDRYLKRAENAYRVGAAYAFQIVEHLREEPHDICLDAVVTEWDILYRV